MTDTTREQIENAFDNFNKWQTYGVVFDLMTRRKVTLGEIKQIAQEHAGIAPSVIEMRRRDVLGQVGGLAAHRRNAC